MPSRLNVFLLLLLLPFASGCFARHSHLNHDLDQEAVAALQPGVTTAREVMKLLGAPTEVVQLGHRSAYRYDHTQEKSVGLFLLVIFLNGEDLKSDRVWVFFDGNDVLTHVGSTFEAEDVSYDVPLF